MRFLILLLALLTASAAFADYDCKVSPNDRLRIVACYDDTYAIQWLSGREWKNLTECGMSLQSARDLKAEDLKYELRTHKENCGSLIKDPVEIVDPAPTWKDLPRYRPPSLYNYTIPAFNSYSTLRR